MRHISTEHKTLSQYRLERANEDIATAQRNFESGDYRAANNRA